MSASIRATVAAAGAEELDGGGVEGAAAGRADRRLLVGEELAVLGEVGLLLVPERAAQIAVQLGGPVVHAADEVVAGIEAQGGRAAFLPFDASDPASAAAFAEALADARAAGFAEEDPSADLEGLDAAAKIDGKVFHAGTALKDGQIVTAGGRVLCATAIGASVADAQQQAYRLAEKIRWNGMFHRNDIGYRAIAREQGEG